VGKWPPIIFWSHVLLEHAFYSSLHTGSGYTMMGFATYSVSRGANKYDFIRPYPDPDPKFSKYGKDFLNKFNLNMNMIFLIRVHIRILYGSELDRMISEYPVDYLY